MYFNYLQEALNQLKILDESKEDIQRFIDKFGQKTYDDFLKAKDRLKNKGQSVDLTYHIKNTSPEEMMNILVSLYDKGSDEQKRRQVQGTDKEIRGKYNYLGTKNGFAVYEPLDVYASMDLGVNTGWCTTGRYGHYGHPEFTPSLKDAISHWENYTLGGKRLFYFLDPGTKYGKYAVLMMNSPEKLNELVGNTYVKTSNIEIYNERDEKDFSVLNKLPLNLLPEIEIDMETVDNFTYTGEEIPDEVKENLRFVKVSDKIKKITYNDFYMMPSLCGVTIPNNSVTEIDDDAFYDCPNLSHIKLPNSLIKIGDGVFECSGLEDIKIPNSVTYIGDSFCNCPYLENVTIPDSVTYISDGAFSGSPNVKFLCNRDSFASKKAEEWNIPIKYLD